MIHYAARQGDFGGEITVHEAPFSEFQQDLTLVYALDFPESGEYRLYSPAQTVERARSRLGEDKYSLPFNNCEHFAIWCKTGLHQSGRVDMWLERAMKCARRYVQKPL